MKTVIRNSYTPVVGDYCEKIVIDLETRSAYLFDCDGVFTPFSNVDAAEIIEAAVAEANAYTDDVAETKVDKEEGKGLSTNDFTNSYKDKLDGIEEGAQVNVIESVSVNGTTLTVTDKNVDISVPTKTSDLQNDSGFITNDVDDLANYYTAAQTDDVVRGEADARQLADADLQSQIDAIVSSSDVVDIVGTYAELQAYDTSHLSDKDIIKVLTDETHGDATSYFRFDKPNNTWTYIGSEGPFYTKSESDSTFVPLTRTVNNKPLSSNITLTAADVGALPDTTVIPTVNDATLTIQKNGSTVTTFTANSATNKTANITVPTKTSDIANDGSDGTSTYVEADDLAAVATSGSYNDLSDTPTIYDPEDYYWANIKVSDTSATDTSPTFKQATFTGASTSGYPHLIGNGGSLTFAATPGTWSSGTGALVLNTTNFRPSSGETGNIDLGRSDSLWKNLYLDQAIYHGTYKLTLPNQAGTVALTSDIPTVNDATLTIQKNGTTIDTFTANSATNKTVNVTVPVNTSDLTNDSGFIDNTVSNLTNYYDQTAINSMFNALPAVPTKTSDLTNDSGFVSDTDYASANTAGVIKVGNNLSIDANGVLSATGTTSLDWANITNKPTNVSYWTNDAGYITSAALPTKTSDLTNDSGFITSASLPTKTSDLTNDSGFITNSVNNLTNYYKKSDTYTQAEVNSLINALPPVPTKTSDLINDSDFVSDANYVHTDNNYTTADKNKLAGIAAGAEVNVQANWAQTTTTADDYIKNKPSLATVATSGSYNDLSNKPTIPTVDASLSTSSTNAIQNKAVATALNDKVDVASVDLTNQTTTLLVQIKALGTAQKNYGRFYSKTDGGSANISDKPTGSTNASFVCVAYQSRNNGSSDYTYQVLCWVQADTNPYKATVTSSSASISWARQQPTVNNGTLTIQKNGTNVQTFTANQSGNVTANITVPTKVSELTSDVGGNSFYGTCTTAAATAAKEVTVSSDQNFVLKTGVMVTFALPASNTAQNPTINVNNTGAKQVKYNSSVITTSNLNRVGYSTRPTTFVYDGTYWVWVSWSVDDNTTYSTMSVNEGKTGTATSARTMRADYLKQIIDYHIRTADNLTPADDTTAEWKTALGSVNGSYYTWYSTASKFTHQPSQYGFLETFIQGNDIYQRWHTQSSGPILYRSGNGSGWSNPSDGTWNTVATTANIPTNLSDLYNDMGFASYSAGDHIDITNDVISAVDYVHSENPVAVTGSTPTVTSGMIADGAITASKLAAGVNLTLTLSTTDIGEGAALAANTLYGVYQ